MSARDLEALDRHALVLAIWLPLALVASALFHYGLGAGGWPFSAAGFAALIAAFVGHVIVNIVRGTHFTQKEVAFGLVLYGSGVMALGLAVLLSPVFRDTSALSVSLGFLSLAAAVIFTMITWLGARGAFESFDLIRRFRP